MQSVTLYKRRIIDDAHAFKTAATFIFISFLVLKRNLLIFANNSLHCFWCDCKRKAKKTDEALPSRKMSSRLFYAYAHHHRVLLTETLHILYFSIKEKNYLLIRWFATRRKFSHTNNFVAIFRNGVYTSIQFKILVEKINFFLLFLLKGKFFFIVMSGRWTIKWHWNGIQNIDKKCCWNIQSIASS